MIYVIDEDITQMKPFVLEMLLRGMDVKQIKDADQALEQITNLTNDDILLIDVMLAANPREGKSQFTREETKDFKITGICLLRMLFNKFPSFRRSRAILFSQASSQTMQSDISQYAKESGCSYLYKNNFYDPIQFGDTLEALLKGE